MWKHRFPLKGSVPLPGLIAMSDIRICPTKKQVDQHFGCPSQELPR